MTALSFGGERATESTHRDGPFGYIAMQSVTRDADGSLYAGPQWFDSNGDGHLDAGATKPYLDGTVDPPAVDRGTHDNEYPVSYERSLPDSPAYIFIDATIHSGANVPGFKLTGSVAGYEFDGTASLLAGDNTVRVRAFSDKLPTTIDSRDLAIDWHASFDGGKTFASTELVTTHNWLYVTGGEATTAFETVLYLGCRGAKGKRPHDRGETEPPATNTNDHGVVDGVWSEFAHKPPMTYEVNGQLMSYSHATKLINVNGSIYEIADYGSTAAEMLSSTYSGRGQCTAWADLFVLTLAAQGESAVSTRIVRPTWSRAIAVIPEPAQGSGGTNYELGTRAKGGFTFHQVVKVSAYPSRIYDPSYGQMIEVLTIGEAELLYEDTYIPGFFDNSNSWVPVILGNPKQVTFDPYTP